MESNPFIYLVTTAILTVGLTATTVIWHYEMLLKNHDMVEIGTYTLNSKLVESWVPK